MPWFAGVIRTAVADLDRETQDRYEVVIRATDMAGQLGGLSGSTTVTIVITDVNDNPPRFPQSESWQRVGVSTAWDRSSALGAAWHGAAGWQHWDSGTHSPLPGSEHIPAL